MGGFTNFPNGVASMGIPLLGGGMTIPVMGKGAKAFFVDPANGSDGNSGLSMARPLDTVSAAYAKTVDKRGDVIYLLNDGNASGTARESSTLTWAKDNTHLVGLCAPTLLSQRARISPPTTATAILTPQLKVTGHGNIFANLSLFEGTSEDSVASVCVEIELGTRNYFWNVAMMNMGDATNGHSGDEAGSAHLLLDGGSENTFDSCYIGLDTASRSAANASVRFRKNGTTTSARNIFRNCIFPMLADAATPLFIDANESGCVDRFNLFDHCIFTNAVGSTGTALTAASAIHASAGGLFLMKDCMLVGADDWHATDTANMKLVGHAWSTDDVTIGIAADVDVTA